MDKMSKLDGTQGESQAFETMLDAAAIGIEDSAPELAGDKEKLEEALDMPTIVKIIEVCGGIKLDDPNLLTAALLAGQNSN